MFVSLLIIICNLTEILPLRIRFFGLFLLSSISGYPVGSKLLDLYCSKKYIKEETAALLLPAFINAGPGFIINTIGLGILNNKLFLLNCLTKEIKKMQEDDAIGSSQVAF